jgi:hypothetical protein
MIIQLLLEWFSKKFVKASKIGGMHMQSHLLRLKNYKTPVVKLLKIFFISIKSYIFDHKTKQ